MSRKSSVVESLRRMSKPEVFRRYSSTKLYGDKGKLKANALESDANLEAECDDKEDIRSPRATIFSLPIELQIQIWDSLSFRDLCAARQASTAFNDLLSEGDIPRQYMMAYFNVDQLAVNPITVPATFRGLLEMVMRERLLDNVAVQLVKYTTEKILLTKQIRRGCVRYSYREHWLYDGAQPPLAILEHYFSQCRSILIAVATEVPTHTTAEEEFKRLSRKAITAYPTEQITSARSCFLFLTWLARSTLGRPSYVGRIERTLRGWVSDPVDLDDFYQYLVLTNIQAYAALLRVKTYKERRQVIEYTLRQLNPATSVNWRAKWWASASKLNEDVTETQAKGALKVKLQAGMLWTDSAEEVLLSRGVAIEGEPSENGSPWQAMAFLNGLAGYNLLNGDRLAGAMRTSSLDHDPALLLAGPADHDGANQE